MMMRRRQLLQTTLAVGVAGHATSDAAVPWKIVDSNVSLFRWPFRRLPLDTTDRLAEKMKELGVATCLAGSFDGILHRDLASANRRLFEECRSREGLVAIGTVNPALPGWKNDLERCAEEFAMPGVRLFPGYHGYALDDPPFEKLIQAAADLGLFVQVVAALEDVRTQPDRLRVADVDLAPLGHRAAGRIQILNSRPRGRMLDELAKRPEIFFDTARVESTDGVATLLKSIPVNRVLLGSHAPFLIPEASLIRVHESDLTATVLRAILETNARSFLGGDE